MDAFGQSIIAAPQQPTLENSTVLTTLSVFGPRQIQKTKGGAVFTIDQYSDGLLGVKCLISDVQ